MFSPPDLVSAVRSHGEIGDRDEANGIQPQKSHRKRFIEATPEHIHTPFPGFRLEAFYDRGSP